MPIKGLTNREAAFPQLGVLRKGGEKPGNGIGKDLTYFRFTSDDQAAVEAFAHFYGEQPDTINVILPYRTADENFSAWREDWVAGGLKHRCDGETMVLWLDKDGKYQTAPKKCTGGCKPVGRLSVIVPEFKRFAFVTVLTTSLHDIMTLSENLAALEMIRGDLRGIPLVLRRRPRKVSTPGPQGKRVRREKWLLTLEAAPQWVRLELAAQEAAALPQLPAGPLPEMDAPDDDNGVVVDAKTGEILDTGAPAEYADYTPVEEEEEQAPPQQRNKAAAPSRPLSAAAVRDIIHKKTNRNGGRDVSGEPITEAQVGLVAGLMTKAVTANGTDAAEVDRRRHAVLEYLVGVDSTRALQKTEASAIIDWLTVKGETSLNEYAGREAAACYAAWQIEQGQMEFPFGDDGDGEASDD